MNQLVILAAAFIVAFASSQKAVAVESARELANKCQKIGKNHSDKRRRVYIPNTRGSLQCWGYMQAIQNLVVLVDQDGNRILGVCAPEETTLLDLINSFLAYTRKYPGELKENTAAVAIKAMQEAYPCPH
jgi:hypothetical protein